MHFEHLVVINDPLNSLLEPLSHAQVWRGLVLRAVEPTLFVPWLDQCAILDYQADKVYRRLRYGDILIEDKVSFLPQQQVCYEVPQQNDIPASRLVVIIEQPGEGALVVRFRYGDDIEQTADGMDAFYNEFRHSAYQESDIDTIRLIRQFANEQKFDMPSSYD